MTSLFNALAAFDDERTKALELSLCGISHIVDGNDASHFEMMDGDEEEGRYSFTNMTGSAVTMDPDAIDVAYIEEVVV